MNTKYKNIKKIGGEIFYSADEVFKKWARSKSFQKAYDNEMTHLKLAQQVREMRLARKFTQKILAEKAKMPQSVIARLESGEHSFSLGTLCRVAKVFGKEIQLA